MLKQIECDENPCQHNASCTESITPGEYSCTCTDEYKGKNCEELKIKTCNEMPCQNDGVCIDKIDDTSQEGVKYTCDCKNGWEGMNCDMKKNFCDSYDVKCKNNGTCESKWDTFVSILRFCCLFAVLQ